MHSTHMRAVEHTNQGGLRTDYAAWVNHTEKRCSREALRIHMFMHQCLGACVGMK
jgi:hypothetical protein